MRVTKRIINCLKENKFQAVLLIITIIFQPLIFLLVRFPPYEDEVKILLAAISEKGTLNETALNNFASWSSGQFSSLFFLPREIFRILPLEILYTPSLYRIIPLLFSVATLILFFVFLLRVTKDYKTSVLSTFFLSVSPAFFQLSFFYFPYLLSIFLLFSYLTIDNYNSSRLNFLLKVIIFFGLLFSSWLGLPILLCLLIYEFAKKGKTFSLKLPIVLALFVLVFIYSEKSSTPYLQSIKNQSIFSRISFSKTASDVVERYETESFINNSDSVFPVTLKKISYNKAFFLYKDSAVYFVSLFDLERWFSPRQSNVDGKGLPIFYWWQLLFLIPAGLSIREVKGRIKSLLIISFFSALIFSFTFIDFPFLIKTVLLLPIISYLSALGLLILIKSASRHIWFQRTITFSFSLLIIVGITSFYFDVFKRPLVWFNNRPYLYQELNKWIKEEKPTEPITITTLFGPAALYSAYFHQIKPEKFWLEYNSSGPLKMDNLIFNSFDLSVQTPINKGIYIGMPGEIFGPNAKNEIKSPEESLPDNYRLLKIIPHPDTVTYGYGSGLSIVEIIDK